MKKSHFLHQRLFPFSRLPRRSGGRGRRTTLAVAATGNTTTTTAAAPASPKQSVETEAKHYLVTNSGEGTLRHQTFSPSTSATPRTMTSHGKRQHPNPMRFTRGGRMAVWSGQDSCFCPSLFRPSTVLLNKKGQPPPPQQQQPSKSSDKEASSPAKPLLKGDEKDSYMESSIGEYVEERTAIPPKPTPPPGATVAAAVAAAASEPLTGPPEADAPVPPPPVESGHILREEKAPPEGEAAGAEEGVVEVPPPPSPPPTVVPGEKASDIPVRRVVAKVWSHLWPKGNPKMKVLVVTSVACVLAAKTLKVAVPFWFKSIVDLLAGGAATSTAVATVGPFAVGTFGCVVAYGICRLTASVTEELKTVLFAPVGGHASTELAMEMFDKLHHLDLQFHLNRETGVLSKDLDRGSRAFWQLAYALLFMVVPTTFEMALVCTALNAQAGPQFIGVALVAVVSYVVWTLTVTNWRAKFRARYNAYDSRVGGLIVDSMLNYETVKYFGSDRYESARIRTETTKMNKELVKLDQTVAVLNFGQNLIFLFAGVLSLYWCTCGVVAGAMTVGDLVLVDALLMQLYLPLSYLGMIYREIQTATQNMQAMILLLDQKNRVVESPDAVPYVYRNGTIELDRVCFQYKEGDGRHVLRDLSLIIPGGKTVAFVGPSGSGKSTIFRLLFRFFDPISGQLRIDGQPLTQLQLRSFRDAIGVVPQDTVLFNESVRYNIRYGKMDATDAEIEAVARRASLHETVSRMPKGYDTSVGERGLKLSGGEKQRVAIARVLLEDPPILLADEATSALDSTTELNVMKTLRHATGRDAPRTIILIAHRLTTVRDADIIFVLDGKGGLAEQGSHDELLAKQGLYATLWLQQLKDSRKAEKGESADKESQK